MISSTYNGDQKNNCFYFLCFRNLKVVQGDIDSLYNFFNKSYHSNEFYIRDVVQFTKNVIDDLSLKTHLDSLPAVLSEMWEIMGDTGKKIGKGIRWVVEKVENLHLKILVKTLVTCRLRCTIRAQRSL